MDTKPTRMPIPLNESARLDALNWLKILDTSGTANFDDITAAAASFYKVPIALVSLIDAKRQWFKSKQGLDVPETSRDISFCTHAIMEPEHLLVQDALTDSRFVDNPLVTGNPEIRFYAGAPLFLSQGIALGTLCIIDRVPRPDIEDLSRLKLLAEKTVKEIVSHYEALENPTSTTTPVTPSFSYQTKKSDGEICFFINGELTAHDADGFHRELLAQVDRNGTRRIIFNLTHCEYIDAHSFNILLKIATDAEDAWMKFACIGASEDLVDLFESLNAQHLLAKE